MSLYSREFYRRLRQKVRHEIRASPELREEARLTQRARPARSVALSGLCFPATVTFMVLGMLFPGGALLGSLLIVWSAVVIVMRAGQFQSYGTGRNGAAVFLGLPVTHRQVFEAGLTAPLYASLWSLADAFAAFGAAGWIGERPLSVEYGALAGAVLIWISVLTTGIIALWRWPHAKYQAAAGILIFLCAVSVPIIATGAIPPDRWSGIVGTLSWITPPGWAYQLATWLTHESGDFPVIAAALLALWSAFAVPCFRAIADRFRFWYPDTTLPVLPPTEEQDSPLPSASPNPSDSNSLPQTSSASPTEAIEAQIRRADFLKPFGGARLGWIDRTIASRMGNDSTHLDYLVIGMPFWTVTFRWGLMCLLGTGVLAFLIHAWSPGPARWIAGPGLFAAVAFCTPIFGGAWSGLLLGPIGQRRIAAFTLLPIVANEIRRVVLRSNFWRFLYAIPCWLIASGLAGYFFDTPPLKALLWGAEAWLAALLLQPFFLVFHFSKGTNDTSGGIVRTLIFFFFCFFVMGCVGALFVAHVAPVSRLWHVAPFLLLASASFGFEAYYRRIYHSQRFDLLAKAAA